VERPKLAEDERLVTWLEAQIGENVAAGDVDAVKNLANKAALVIGVRQFGLDGVRQQSAELKSIYDSVMAGANLLSLMFGFIDAPDSSQAGWYISPKNSELADESIGPLFEDQMRHAAHNGDVGALPSGQRTHGPLAQPGRFWHGTGHEPARKLSCW